MEVQTSGKSIDSVLERVLCMNILSSDYFKELYRLKTYHDVVDEIYNQVDHVEPWMTGNCRGPSTAFCLLYKFFTMKLTVKQMQGLLNHEDSPYIRAVGFLYLRYVGEPRSLWSWFEEYVTDGEEFSPGSNGKMTTIGVFVRDLLLDQYYFDTLFPRIPVPIMRQLTGNLERLKLSTRSAGVTGASNRHSLDDTARRPPSVKAALSVSFGQRAPHRSSTRDSSPVRRSATREQRTADDRIGPDRSRERVDRETGLGFTSHKEKTRERVDKETGLGFNSHRDTGSARQKGGDSSRIEERNGESVRLSATDGQFTTSGFHRDSDNEASIPSNSSDGIRSNRMKVDEVRRKRERGHREDVEQYKSRSSEKRKERNRRGRERSRSYSPQKDRDEEDIRLMRTHRGLGNQGNSLGKLRDVYGDRSSKGSPATCNTGSSKGSAEDVIHLGDGRWT